MLAAEGANRLTFNFYIVQSLILAEKLTCFRLYEVQEQTNDRVGGKLQQRLPVVGAGGGAGACLGRGTGQPSGTAVGRGVRSTGVRIARDAQSRLKSARLYEFHFQRIICKTH